MTIHATAVIASGAKIDANVTIGPYAVIDSTVTIGAGSEIGAHAVISGCTTIGTGTSIGPFAHIGGAPQDLKYADEETKLIIGNDNQIREYVSIHRGTVSGHGQTTIGNNNLIMAYCHIAHDCIIGDHVIFANAATLGGHVEIENHATLGGLVAVHQFTRIGEFAYIGGLSGISKDIPPYVIMSGIRNQMRVTGINKIGLRRNGFDNETIGNLGRAYKIIFRTPELLLQDALQEARRQFPECPAVGHLVDFFVNSSRSVVRTGSDE